jgi:hypothetical protein
VCGLLRRKDLQDACVASGTVAVTGASTVPCLTAAVRVLSSFDCGQAPAEPPTQTPCVIVCSVVLYFGMHSLPCSQLQVVDRYLPEFDVLKVRDRSRA